MCDRFICEAVWSWTFVGIFWIIDSILLLVNSVQTFYFLMIQFWKIVYF